MNKIEELKNNEFKGFFLNAYSICLIKHIFKIKKQMKLYRSLLLLAFIGISVISNGQIKFEHGSWNEILNKAKNENKIIFLDCYTQHCGPCKVMAKTTFMDVEVGKFYNEKFINVKMDMHTEDGEMLGKKYSIMAYPTLLFLESNGNELHRTVGGYKTEGFLKLGQDFLSGVTLSSYDEKYKKGNYSSDFIPQYLKVLNQAYKHDKVIEVLDKYFQDTPKNELASSENYELLKEYGKDYKSLMFQYLLTNQNKFIQLYGAGDVNKFIELVCIRAWKKFSTYNKEEKRFIVDKPAFEALAFDMKEKQVPNVDAIITQSKAYIALTEKNYETYIEEVDKGFSKGYFPNDIENRIKFIKPMRIRKNTNPQVAGAVLRWVEETRKFPNLNERTVKFLTDLENKCKDCL